MSSDFDDRDTQLFSLRRVKQHLFMLKSLPRAGTPGRTNHCATKMCGASEEGMSSYSALSYGYKTAFS